MNTHSKPICDTDPSRRGGIDLNAVTQAEAEQDGRGLRQPALVNHAPTGHGPAGFDPARGEPNVIDLDWEAWNTLVKAAAESDWIPPEYFVNDWVSDCADFLRHGGRQS